jgi:glucose/arabinose dehydrogenase
MSSRPLACLALALAACKASTPAEPPVDPGFRLSDHATGLSQPTDLAFLPDGSAAITEKTGALKIRAPQGAITVAGTFSVDTESEKGLLGVVADPDFGANRRLFLYYSRADAAGGDDTDRNRVVSVRLGTDGTVEAGSEVVLVSGLRGPANHDGGALAIGPDGKLYVGAGDTGCNSGSAPEPPDDPANFFATCLSNGNGKILRVNLDGSVPGDNPLAAVATASACGATCGTDVSGTGLAAPRRDLWAWGFRNPWRFAFDPSTGLLWVGDVGEVTWEEVTIAEKGRHHGWPWREGAHGWPREKCREIVPDTGDCVDPVYECRHGAASGGGDGGCQSITGGAFLAGPRWPEALRDRYLFGDNVNGRLWTLSLDAERRAVLPGTRVEIGRLAGGPVSLRTGPEGDVYAVVFAGQVVRISPAGAP